MKELKKINVQFFADPNTDPEPNLINPDQNKTQTEPNNQQKVEFSPEQQEYINKLINSAVGKTKSQMDNERAKLEEERKRAEELAKITDEKERKLKEYELKMADYEKERIEMEKERMTNKTMSILSEKKLPINMAKYLVADTEENTTQAVGEFEKSFLEAVSAEVSLRLRGATPEVQNKLTPTVDFSKMSTEEYLKYRDKNKL